MLPRFFHARRQNAIFVLTLASVATLLIADTVATADSVAVVSPPGLENDEGNALFFPEVAFPEPGSMAPPPGIPWRAQEVHPSSAFDSLGDGPLAITSLAWRPDISVNAVTFADWDLTLNLSTTQADSLDPTFEDNYGTGGFTEVFSGSLRLQTDGVPRGDELPHDFDYVVEFDKPFFYDPQQGDLLVEFISPTYLADAWVWADGEAGTGEYIVGLLPFPDAFAGGSALFVTQFNVVGVPPGIFNNPALHNPGLGAKLPPGLRDGLPSASRHAVPEPASAVIALMGCGICLLVRRRRRLTLD